MKNALLKLIGMATLAILFTLNLNAQNNQTFEFPFVDVNGQVLVEV